MNVTLVLVIIMALVVTTQDHTTVIANEVTQATTANTRLTNVCPIHVNMEADVRTTLAHILVHAVAAIQERHVKAMLTNARQVFVATMAYVTIQ